MSTQAFVIKIRWNDDTRRISLDRPPVYQELVELSAQLFNVSAARFKYVDDEKDTITITCDRELSEAISVSHNSKSILCVLVIEATGAPVSIRNKSEKINGVTLDPYASYLAASPKDTPTLAAVQIPAWAKNIQPWVWTKIPGTALSSVPPVPRPLGTTGPRSKIDTWCGATLKRDGSIYMLGAAGGHADYAGNEVNALNLLADKPQWVQLHAASSNESIINGTQFYLDYRPSSTHTYYATQFIDRLNKMIVFASPGVSGPFPPPPPNFPLTGASRSFSFDLNKNEWDSPDYISIMPDGGDFTACLCVKHPLTGDVYYSRSYSSSWYRWTSTANRWDRLSDMSRAPWYAGSAIDIKRDRMLVVGGYSPQPPLVMNLDGTGVAVTYKGLGSTALQLSGYPGVIYDEKMDQYIVAYNDGASSTIKVLTVSAEDFTVSSPNITGTAPATRVNGIQNSIQYVPQLQGFVMANDYNGDVFFVSTSSLGASEAVPKVTPVVPKATPAEQGILATLCEMGFKGDTLSVLRSHNGDLMATIKTLLRN